MVDSGRPTEACVMGTQSIKKWENGKCHFTVLYSGLDSIDGTPTSASATLPYYKKTMHIDEDWPCTYHMIVYRSPSATCL